MIYVSPVGKLKITVSGGFVNEILFLKTGDESNAPVTSLSFDDEKILKNCITQLHEYFEGKRKIFKLPLKQHGTAFQQKVWDQLMQIPYGKTISYMKLAQDLGDVKVIRAAASANGKNNLPIVVPCHRVIGKNGTLTGYGGGLPTKKWLLEHENKYAHGVSLLF
jgi:methylated-DNA-[protein]-cysteine S-methyltransferase